MQEIDGGNTIFWIGRTEIVKNEAGVPIRNDLVKRLESLPAVINDRLMSIGICIGRNKYATIFICYALNIKSSVEIKKHLPSELHNQLWCNVIGKQHGFGKAKSNGHLLLFICSEYRLVITITIFQLPDHRKISWRHHFCNHYHLIDYAIMKSPFRKEVTINRSFSICECCRLMWSKVRFSIGILRFVTITLNQLKEVDVKKLRITLNWKSLDSLWQQSMNKLILHQLWIN